MTNRACESLTSPTLNHDSAIEPQGGDLYRLEMKSMVNNDSDDSDSEIFRVKRPSSLRAEKRNLNSMSSKHLDPQVILYPPSFHHVKLC